MCFAGLTPLSKGSPLSKPIKIAIEAESGVSTDDSDWTEVVPKIAFLDALTRQCQNRMQRFAKGVAAYHHHPHRRTVERSLEWRGVPGVPVQDFGGAQGAVPLVVVPSLINRSTVLDLYPDRSFMRFLAAHGVHAYLLDWTAQGAAPEGANITHYIQHMLVPVLRTLGEAHGRTPVLAGYCMGGTLAVAAPALHEDLISGLVLLAAPWDFHADTVGLRKWLTLAQPGLTALIEGCGEAPVDLLQALFAGLDPSLVGRKFRSFAEMDPDSDAARRFVVLEDWLNDGVPLSGPVAKECLFDWYLDNTPCRGEWKVGGRTIDPERISCPTLTVIPSRDRIVPPASAESLAAAIPNATVHNVALGHIGMMTGGRAEKEVFDPVADWIRNAASQ
jgi:polyhydroxyalkanoate synthase